MSNILVTSRKREAVSSFDERTVILSVLFCFVGRLTEDNELWVEQLCGQIMDASIWGGCAAGGRRMKEFVVDDVAEIVRAVVQQF